MSFPVKERRGALEAGLWRGRNDEPDTSSPQKIMTKLDEIVRNNQLMALESDYNHERWLWVKSY